MSEGTGAPSVPHVLLVDDEEDIRLIAAIALRRTAGWHVHVAGSGAEAVDIARMERLDAAILDVMMPGMDGPATLAALRADPVTAVIPIVFMTAKSQPQELARLRAIGAAGVVAKPFDPMTLATDLADVLGWT